MWATLTSAWPGSGSCSFWATCLVSLHVPGCRGTCTAIGNGTGTAHVRGYVDDAVYGTVVRKRVGYAYNKQTRKTGETHRMMATATIDRMRDAFSQDPADVSRRVRERCEALLKDPVHMAKLYKS